MDLLEAVFFFLSYKILCCCVHCSFRTEPISDSIYNQAGPVAMPDQSHPTTSRAEPKGPGSTPASGGYWPLMWHETSPGEKLIDAVAQDLEEETQQRVMTSTPIIHQARRVDLANTASVIRAVERIQRTNVTAIGQYFSPRYRQSWPSYQSISR